MRNTGYNLITITFGRHSQSLYLIQRNTYRESSFPDFVGIHINVALTSRETLAHILDNVLELDGKYKKNLRDTLDITYKRITSVTYEDVTGHKDKKLLIPPVGESLRTNNYKMSPSNPHLWQSW